MKQIIEGGHFYLKEGFNTEAAIGWGKVKDKSKINGNHSMLFIDDVHEKSLTESPEIIKLKLDLSVIKSELSQQCLNIINQLNEENQNEEVFIVSPNHIVLESEMTLYSEKVFNILRGLPKRKRLRTREGHGSFCSNIKVSHPNGNPTCVGYDLGLTMLKQKMGFQRAVNILPEAFYTQQEKVKRIYRKIDPDFPIDQDYY